MAIVKKIRAELIAVIDRSREVYTLELRPQGRGVSFAPGQFLHLALDDYDPSCGWPESRCFSVQSAPGEAVVRLTYAVKGSFTRRMARELAVGVQVWLKLPYGDLFTQPHSREGTVFVAGGTGITPFLSLFAAPDFADYRRPRLFLGVRSAAHDFYADELERACALNPGFAVIRYLQDRDGFIDAEKVLASGGEQGCYFISGPPGMIRGFKTFLIDRGVDLERVLTDDWE